MRTAAVVVAALVLAPAAFAHAEVSPTSVPTKRTTTITVTVPTESETAATVRLRVVAARGLDLLGTTTWTGRKRGVVRLRLSVRGETAGDYPLGVTQTYSDGRVVRWTGPEGSATPAPVVRVGNPANANRDRLVILLVAGAAVAGWYALRARARQRLE